MKAGKSLDFRYICLVHSAFMFLVSAEVLFPFRFIFNLKHKEKPKIYYPWIFNAERQGLIYLVCVLSVSSMYLQGEEEIKMRINWHLAGVRRDMLPSPARLQAVVHGYPFLGMPACMFDML